MCKSILIILLCKTKSIEYEYICMNLNQQLIRNMTTIKASGHMYK